MLYREPMHFRGEIIPSPPLIFTEGQALRKNRLQRAVIAYHHDPKLTEGGRSLAVAKNLFAVVAAERKQGASLILIFENERQAGSLIALDTASSLTLPEDRLRQQTFHVLRGTATLSFDSQAQRLTRGSLVVIPPNKQVALLKAEQDFLLFKLSSPGMQRSEEQTGEEGALSENGKRTGILVSNLYDLHQVGERKSFMSTDEENSGTSTVSRVNEIEVFYPEMAAEGYQLNGSQAGRLLIYETQTTLDRHTHPLAQHAIYVMDGHGYVEFEGENFDLDPGGLFVVPPHTKHKLGSYGNFLAFVVNTPGIPPTHPQYSEPA